MKSTNRCHWNQWVNVDCLVLGVQRFCNPTCIFVLLEGFESLSKEKNDKVKKDTSGEKMSWWLEKRDQNVWPQIAPEWRAWELFWCGWVPERCSPHLNTTSAQFCCFNINWWFGKAGVGCGFWKCQGFSGLVRFQGFLPRKYFFNWCFSFSPWRIWVPNLE